MTTSPADIPSLKDTLAPDDGDLAASPPEQTLTLTRSVITAVLLSAYFMIVYNGCNWVSSRRAHVGTLYFGWERYIWFVPIGIVPYMSIDIFFFFSPFLCRSGGELRTLARRIIVAITVAGICFLLFPLQMGTATPPVHGFSGWLFAVLGSFDRPYNLVPSLHIALLCILWAIYSRHTRGLVRLLVQLWFVLIVISTLVTNQHHFIDLVGGFILGLICFYVEPDVPMPRDSQSPETANRMRNFRVARNYGMGTLAVALLGFILYPWGLLLVWPATAGALVTLAYLRIGPSVFRKTNGKLPLSTRVLLWPYLIIARIMHIHFKRRSEPFCQVAPGVWLGGRLNSSQARALLDHGISAVLDLTSECSEAVELRRLRYLNLPLLDLTPPTLDEVNTAVAFMRENRDGGVYVHCALGVSRSVCVVAAYLIHLDKEKSVDHSYMTIRSVRSAAQMHPPARKTLEAYRSSLHQ